MRLHGLASGFDTEAMVQSLMSVERLKVDRFAQNKQINLWRQEDYTAINRKMANFILNSKKNVGLNKTSSTGSIANQSWKNLDYVKKATSSNEDVVSVNVVGKAMDGDFDVEVLQLAESAKFDLKLGEEGTSTKLSSLLGEDQSSIKVAGVEIKLDDLVKGTDKSVEDLKVSDLMKHINSNDELRKKGVSAFYDKGTGRMFIQGDAFESEDSSSKFIEGFEAKLSENNSSGRNAKVKINGVEIDNLTSNSVEFNGVKIDFKEKTEKTGPIRVNVSTNTETIMDKIKGLVDEYNELIDEISGVMTQERHPSYHPLSQDEKSAMSDKDVELWEEKAKSGMLKDDETLGRMMAKLRNDLYKKVEGLSGSFDHITDIGISTQKYSKGAAGGKLQIDESKLRAAIEEDAEGVMELMFGTGKLDENSTSGKIGSTDKGIFTGIYDNLIDGMKDVIDKSGPGGDSDLLRSVKSNIMIDFVTKKGSISELDKSVKDMEKKIADLETLLIRKEDAYYAQFTRMEKYMYEMNSQSQWLANQMMM